MNSNNNNDENIPGNSGSTNPDSEESKHILPGSLHAKLNSEEEDLNQSIIFADNNLYASAGPELPLVQLNPDGTLVSFSPRSSAYQAPENEKITGVDELGRLVDSLGTVRKLVGLRYAGAQLYYIAKKHPESGQYLAAWFDKESKPHFLYLGDEVLSATMILKIRNRTIDGELSSFDELKSD